MRKNSTSQNKQQTSGQLRIIGGQWRGRKLSFPSVDGLRPTPDRVRETLFNWLAPTISGARCLDLFCGSGALGLEALSRGAGFVDMVDNSAAVIKQMKDNCNLLHCQTAASHQTNALTWLEKHPAEPYDIIFLDPPFRVGLADDCIRILSNGPWFKPCGWLYLEMGKEEHLPMIPPNWKLHREKTAGQVCYRLYSIT